MTGNFFDHLLYSSGKTQSRPKRKLTLPVSIAIHAVVLAAVVILPLMTWEELPEPANGAVKAFFVEPAPPPPPPPPPPAAPKAAMAPKVDAPKIPKPTPEFTAPVDVPKEVTPEPSSGTAAAGEATGGEPDGVEGGVTGGVKGGVVGGVVGGVEGGVPEPAATPPPTTEPEAPKGPVRVGGNISAPHKLKNVEPLYPEVAKQARVAGVVVLEATIGPDGRVDNVKVLRGIPLLNESAMNAVKQWVYSPTLLNGTPVPVIMTVTVNFHMS